MIDHAVQINNPASFVYAPKGTKKPFRVFGVTFRSPTVTYCNQCQRHRFFAAHNKQGEEVFVEWCEWKEAQKATSHQFPLCSAVNYMGQCEGFRSHPSLSLVYVSKSSQDFIEYLRLNSPSRHDSSTDMILFQCLGVG